jgi:hypothetical protein
MNRHVTGEFVDVCVELVFDEFLCWVPSFSTALGV